jgi:hypothetical protein
MGWDGMDGWMGYWNIVVYGYLLIALTTALDLVSSME